LDHCHIQTPVYWPMGAFRLGIAFAISRGGRARRRDGTSAMSGCTFGRALGDTSQSQINFGRVPVPCPGAGMGRRERLNRKRARGFCVGWEGQARGRPRGAVAITKAHIKQVRSTRALRVAPERPPKDGLRMIRTSPRFRRSTKVRSLRAGIALLNTRLPRDTAFARGPGWYCGNLGPCWCSVARRENSCKYCG